MAGLWCNGVQSTAIQVCSGNGLCVGENICQCNAGFSGKDCEYDRAAGANRLYNYNIEVTERLAMLSIAQYDIFTNMVNSLPAAMLQRQLTMIIGLLTYLDAVFDPNAATDMSALGDVSGDTTLSTIQKGAVTSLQAHALRYGYNYFHFDQYTYLTGQASQAIQRTMQSHLWSDFAPAMDNWTQYYRACAVQVGFTQAYDCASNFNEPGLFTALVDTAVEDVLPKLVALRNKVVAAWQQTGEPPGLVAESTGKLLFNNTLPVFNDPSKVVDMYKKVVQSMGVDLSEVVFRNSWYNITGLDAGILELAASDDVRMLVAYDNPVVTGRPVLHGGRLSGWASAVINTDASLAMLVARNGMRPFFNSGNTALYGSQIAYTRGVLNKTVEVLKKVDPSYMGTTDVEEVYRILHRPDPMMDTDSCPLTKAVWELTLYTLERDLLNGQNNVTAANFDQKFQQRMTANLGRPVSWMEIPMGSYVDGSFSYTSINTMGWMFSARMYEKAVQQNAQIASDVKKGVLSSLNAWMSTNVLNKLPLYPSAGVAFSQLLGGEAFSGDALLRHFTFLYNDLYGLNMTAPAGGATVPLDNQDALGGAYAASTSSMYNAMMTGMTGVNQYSPVPTLPSDPAARKAFLEQALEGLQLKDVVNMVRHYLP
jgi:Zn-dependent M32 family carboxypeptidase